MNTEITPWRVTISLLVVGVLCTALTQIVPEEGFQIAGIEFNFYRPFFEPRDTTKQGIADAEAFLEGYDSILEEDSLSDVEKTFDEEKADDELIEERKKLDERGKKKEREKLKESKNRGGKKRDRDKDN